MRALAAAATVAVLALPSAAHAAGAFGDAGGFYSVLGLGQGQTVNALDFASFRASGSPPASYVNQRDMYTGVSNHADSLTVDTLTDYWKNSSFRTADEDNGGGTETPRAGVRIVRDARFRVPRVYGDTRSDLMFGVGYATAEDRLFLMDGISRMASGHMAELTGPGALADDSAELGHQTVSDEELVKQFDALKTQGPLAQRAHQDYLDYIAGINAYIDAARTDPTKMPAEYPALGVQLPEWSVAKSLQSAVYLIAQFTANGGDELKTAELMSAFRKRFGKKWRGYYDDFRSAEDPKTSTVSEVRFNSDRPGKPRKGIVAMPDAGSVVARDAVEGGTPKSRAATAPAWVRSLQSMRSEFARHASNAMLVDAKHSLGGRPVAAMGPQVGYYSPEIFLEIEMHGPGIDVSGVEFPGAAPYVLIGHGKEFAWTGTTPNGDTVDTFAEELCNADGSKPSFKSTSYIRNGKCVPLTIRKQTVSTPTGAGNQTPPQTFTLSALSSVHGSIGKFGTVGGKPVAFAESHVTDGREAQSLLAFMQLAENVPTDGKSFQTVMRNYTGMENWFYVGRKDIAWLQSGVFPRHAKGTDLDLPIWGTGKGDWKGLLPASANPRAVNPKWGYLVSWNNKEAPGWRSPPATWSFGPVVRGRILSDPVQAAMKKGKVSLADVARIATRAAVTDLRGTTVYPAIRKAIGTPTDAKQRQALGLLDAWAKSGALRRDTDGDGIDDQSPAIVLMDQWWPRLARAMFQPVLGKTVVDKIDSVVNPIPTKGTSTFFFDGWFNYVVKDLGRKYQRAYCGRGKKATCQAALRRSLADAIAAGAKVQGNDDMTKWEWHATCPGSPDTCDAITLKAGSAVSTPAFPWHNRGTFHQIDQIGGPATS